MGCHALLQRIFPTQELNPGLPHCRRILYHLSHQGSPRILEWLTYPFSSESSWPRNWTRVSCIAGGFFISWATRESMYKVTERLHMRQVGSWTCITGRWDRSSTVGNLQPLFKLGQWTECVHLRKNAVTGPGGREGWEHAIAAAMEGCGGHWSKMSYVKGGSWASFRVGWIHLLEEDLCGWLPLQIWTNRVKCFLRCQHFP